MALAVDPSTPAVRTGIALTLTSAAFTPPAGGLLLNLVTFDTATAGTSRFETSTSSPARTWTQRQKQATGNGLAAIDSAATGSAVSTTVTTTMTGTGAGSSALMLVPQVITGQHLTAPIGGGAAVAATANHVLSWTPTAVGSLLFVAYSADSTATAASTPPGLTLIPGASYSASSIGQAWRLSAPSSSLAPQSFTFTGAVAGAALAWVEVVPASAPTSTNLLRLGGATPSGLYVGATAASAAYLGSTLVWSP